MDAEALAAEAAILIDYVDRKATCLDDAEMILSNAIYRDPAQFAEETRRLFREHPLCVGPSCLLREPGDYFTFDDTGVPILLLRDREHRVRAFLNVCSHRGAPVAVGSGQLQGGVLSCPYHAWTYTLEGRLRGIPGREGFPNCDRGQLGLTPLPVAERDGMIYVLADPYGRLDIAAVQDELGRDMAGFGLHDHHLFDTTRIPVRQNWKSLLEGYHEFYHFAALHPNTIGAISYNNICHYRQIGPNHRLSAPKLTIGELKDRPRSQWRPRDHVSFVYYAFPATVFFVVEDHFQLWRVYPVDACNSVVYQSLFLPRPPADEAEERHYRAFFEMITRVVIDEDYWLGEMVQRGIDSGIERNVIIGRNEIGVQNMHRQIGRVLGRPPRMAKVA